MKSFVQEYVEDLVTRSDLDWSRLTIIVPNKLVGFYVQKELRRAVSKAQWSPVILTIPELAAQMAGLRSCSASRSLMYLLDAYLECVPKQWSNLEHFMALGHKLHTDFLDVAISMADARQIYRDLRSVKEVEHWGIGEDVLSDSQKAYLVFWNALEQIYERWKALQEEAQEMVYPVMLRHLLNNERRWSDEWRDKHLEVVGVASFQKAEEMLLQMVGRVARLRIVWDADRYYIDNDWHEAGATIRKHAVWLNQSHIPSLLTERAFRIQHVVCDSFHGQCAAIAKLLAELPLEERSKAAVLLPEETWLHPTMHFLSGAQLIDDRGYQDAKGYASLLRWITVVIRIHNHRMVQRKGYFVRDLLEVLDLSREWLLDNNSIARLQMLLRDTNKGYWSKMDLEKAGWFDVESPHWKTLFFNPTGDGLLHAIQRIASDYFDSSDEQSIEFLEVLEQMEQALRTKSIQGDFSALQWLWNSARKQMSGNGIRNVDGEVQVLLMTDTRALDFKYIFIPGLNEGVVPKKSGLDSFVPFDVRAAHGMSMPQDAEASYAYVFYRALQRAEVCTFFSASVDLQKRDQEVSRYLVQIRSELMRANPLIQWEERTYRLATELAIPVQMPRNTEWSKGRIEEWLKGGISASAINTFIACPLDFYFKYIAKVGEPDELEETISDAAMGSLVHLVLERFYSGFIDRYPASSDFDAAIDSMDEWLDHAVNAADRQMDLTTGDNALVRGIARKMLIEYLRFEKSQLEQLPADRSIVGVELDFNFKLDAHSGISMKGKIDRLERLGDAYRVLDYKTGKVEAKDHVLKSKKNAPLFENQSGKMMQIATYMLAVPSRIPEAQKIEAGFLSFRSIEQGWRMFDSSDATDWKDQYVDYVLQVVEKMRQLETWEHNDKALYCAYCNRLGMDQKEEEQVEPTSESSAE